MDVIYPHTVCLVLHLVQVHVLAISLSVAVVRDDEPLLQQIHHMILQNIFNTVNLLESLIVLDLVFEPLEEVIAVV